jgi:hypothetical protein
VHPRLHRAVALAVFLLGAVWLLFGLLQSAEWFKKVLPGAYSRFVSTPGAIALFLLGIYLIWQTRHVEAQPTIHVIAPSALPANAESQSVKLDENQPTGRARVDVGDYADFLWGYDRRARITVVEVGDGSGETPSAVLQVDNYYGVGGGYQTKKIGAQRYQLPQTSYLYGTGPVLFDYYIGDETFWFLRILVEHVNVRASQVTLNVFYVTHKIKKPAEKAGSD